MKCPYCKNETNGNVSQDYLLSMFVPDDQMFQTNQEETITIFICHLCNGKWRTIHSILTEAMENI